MNKGEFFCKFLFLVEFILCLNRLYYDFCPKGTFKNEFEHVILFCLNFPKKFSSNNKSRAKRSATDNKNAFQVRTPGPHNWKNILERSGDEGSHKPAAVNYLCDLKEGGQLSPLGFSSQLDN